MELSAGIAGYVLRKEVHQVIESKMNSTMKDYNLSGAITSVWDELQENVIIFFLSRIIEYIQLWP